MIHSFRIPLKLVLDLISFVSLAAYRRQGPFCANYVGYFSLTFYLPLCELKWTWKKLKRLSFFQSICEKNQEIFEVSQSFIPPVIDFHSRPMVLIYCYNHHTDIFSITLAPRSIAHILATQENSFHGHGGPKGGLGGFWLILELKWLFLTNFP